jgi:hypothetical protein
MEENPEHRFIRSVLQTNWFTLGYLYGAGMEKAIEKFMEWMKDGNREFERTNDKVFSITVDGMSEYNTMERFSAYLKKDGIN